MNEMIRFIVYLACLGLIQAKLLDLSCKSIRDFVDGHNKRRLQVAQNKVPGHPGAMDMKYIVWDEELAEKAADWASHGKFSHSPDRSIDSERFDTGENLYIYMTTEQNYKFNPTLALDAWFEEYKDWEFNPLTTDDFTSEPEIGHYTQMIWANSIYVGCAINNSRDGKWNKFLVVCNYGPAGNILERTPYKSGKGSGRLSCGTSDCSNKYGDSC